MPNAISTTFAHIRTFFTRGYWPVLFLNTVLVPRRNYRVARDVAYGPDPRQKLDIYMPRDLKAPAPVLLFFYGGSWQTGDKNMYPFLGEAFASKGIVTVVVDYGLYPEVSFPAFVKDGALAFRFLLDEVAKYGGDPSRTFLSGHSAGAHIVTLLANDFSYLNAIGVDPARIRGVIGISGPYDFLPLKDHALIALFGGDNVVETQPINFVDGKRAPTLLITGKNDDTVRPRNSVRMAAKLESFGNEVRVIQYDGIGHIDIIASLARGFRHRTSLREDITQFVMAH